MWYWYRLLPRTDEAPSSVFRTYLPPLPPVTPQDVGSLALIASGNDAHGSLSSLYLDRWTQMVTHQRDQIILASLYAVESSCSKLYTPKNQTK